jgi:hypothetical protein
MVVVEMAGALHQEIAGKLSIWHAAQLLILLPAAKTNPCRF